MDSRRITAKLFHTVVVLGMGLAQSGCADDSPAPSPTADGGGSSSGSTNTSSGAIADAGGASKDAFAGWFCCG